MYETSAHNTYALFWVLICIQLCGPIVPKWFAMFQTPHIALTFKLWETLW